MALIAFTSDKALANDIYVHQIGDDLDLDVVQDGEDNSFTFCATTVTTDATCGTGWNKGNHSDNSTVAVSMTGDDNEIYMSHAAGINNSNTRKSAIAITGHRNYVQNRLVNAASSGSWGGEKETNITIAGDDNTVKHNSGSYGEAEGNISVTGDDNTVLLYQRSRNTLANITVTNAGGPVTASIQQLGSSYQDTTALSTSVSNYCTIATGCTVSITQN